MARNATRLSTGSQGSYPLKARAWNFATPPRASCGQKSRDSIAIDKSVEERDVRTASCHELSSHHSGEHGFGACLTRFRADRSRSNQRLLQPCNIDVGEDLDFRFYRLRQVVILGTHEAAEAHAVLVCEGAAKGFREEAQSLCRVGIFVPDFFKISSGILPVPFGDR